MEDILNLIKLLFVDHALAASGGALCMVFVTLLTDRVRVWPTWNSPWRTFLGTAFAAMGMGLNQLQNPGGTSLAISALMTSLPTLIAEFIAARNGGLPKMPKPRIIGLTLLFLLCPSCATWTKADTRTVVDITKDLVERVCSPDDPSLDACIAKLLAARRMSLAGDAGR